MNLLLIILSLSFLKDKIILSTTGSDFLNDITLYMNELCSHNGIPQLTKNKTEVICECDKRYTNEPRESKKRYINNKHFIQCSYERKRRFLCFFLSAIAPIGMDYLYLGHIGIFILILFIFCFNAVLIVFSIVLNYRLEKKEEEEKRQKKLKKANYKFELKNITKINKTCVKAINIFSNLFMLAQAIFWIVNSILESLGIIRDINHVETENDLYYLFEPAEK